MQQVVHALKLAANATTIDSSSLVQMLMDDDEYGEMTGLIHASFDGSNVSLSFQNGTNLTVVVVDSAQGSVQICYKHESVNELLDGPVPNDGPARADGAAHAVGTATLSGQAVRPTCNAYTRAHACSRQTCTQLLVCLVAIAVPKHMWHVPRIYLVLFRVICTCRGWEGMSCWERSCFPLPQAEPGKSWMADYMAHIQGIDAMTHQIANGGKGASSTMATSSIWDALSNSMRCIDQVAVCVGGCVVGWQCGAALPACPSCPLLSCPSCPSCPLPTAIPCVDLFGSCCDRRRVETEA